MNLSEVTALEWFMSNRYSCKTAESTTRDLRMLFYQKVILESELATYLYDDYVENNALTALVRGVHSRSEITELYLTPEQYSDVGYKVHVKNLMGNPVACNSGSTKSYICDILDIDNCELLRDFVKVEAINNIKSTLLSFLPDHRASKDWRTKRYNKKSFTSYMSSIEDAETFCTLFLIALHSLREEDKSNYKTIVLIGDLDVPEFITESLNIITVRELT